MQKIIIVLLTVLLALAQPTPGGLPQEADYSREARTALAAHHLYSGLWVVGRGYQRTPPEVLAQDIAPFRAFGWEESFKYEIDPKRRRVTVSSPGNPPRTAQYNGDQGCAILPRGPRGPREMDNVYFKPVRVPRKLPAAATQPWPTGDAGATAPMPAGVSLDVVQAALEWGMA
jgi:hypothetical protein